MSAITPMNFEGDPTRNWFRWRRNFERYMSTQDWKNSSQDVLAMQFIVAFGEKAIGICVELNLSQKEMCDMDTLMLKFEEHFVPSKNLTQYRYVLFSRKQDKNETIEEYSTLLQRLSKKCDFGEQTDDILKMIFVGGIKDDICQRKLLEADRSWEEAVNFAMLAEHINKTCMEMCDKASVSKVEKTSVGKDDKGNKNKSDKANKNKNDKGSDAKVDKGDKKFCGFCGQKHERANCPAYKKICGICKKPNHFTKMCRHKKTDGFVMV